MYILFTKQTAASQMTGVKMSYDQWEPLTRQMHMDDTYAKNVQNNVTLTY